MINVFHILSRERSAHTAKRMCPTEHCTTGETPRARTSAKVVISCSTFSNANHGYCQTAVLWSCRGLRDCRDVVWAS